MGSRLFQGLELPLAAGVQCLATLLMMDLFVLAGCQAFPACCHCHCCRRCCCITCLGVLQVAGTVGRKLMLGVRQGLQLDARTTLDVRCKVGQQPWWAVCHLLVLGHGVRVVAVPQQFGLCAPLIKGEGS